MDYGKSSLLIIIGFTLGLSTGYSLFSETDESRIAFAKFGDGQVVRGSEVHERIKIPLQNLENAIYELKLSTTQNIVAERLGINQTANKLEVPPLPPESTTGKQLGSKSKSAKMKMQLARERQVQKIQLTHDEKFRKTFADLKIEYSIPSKKHERQKVTSGPFRIHKGSHAANELVVFSNYHCPFCSVSERRLAELKNKWGDKIVVYRRFTTSDADLPLVRRTIEAAYCAAEQDRFEQFDKQMSEQPAQSEEEIKSTIQKLGLDPEEFQSCIKSEKIKSRIDGDLKEASDLGIDQAPAFVLDGRVFPGTSLLGVLETALK